MGILRKAALECCDLISFLPSAIEVRQERYIVHVRSVGEQERQDMWQSSPQLHELGKLH